MKRHLKRVISVAAIAGAGLMMFGAPAQAKQVSMYNTGMFSGNQYSSVVQVPVSVCGNAIAVFGFANAGCQGGAFAGNWDGGWDDDDMNGGPASWILSQTWS